MNKLDERRTIMQVVEMKTEVQPGAPAAEQAQPASRKASYRLWLIGAAVLGIPLALYGGWDWLAATGLATILVAVAPCLAMCALGLCMGRGKKAGPSLTDIRKTFETQTGEPPSRG